jgi:uncharacterized protein GlcG (DUF336 family)
MNLTLQHAEEILARARRRAEIIGVPMNVAVLDSAGHLKAFVRMDAAVLGSIDIALGKARTSVLFSSNSETIWEYCRPGGPSPGLENTNGGLVPFAGGIPIRGGKGEVIGAVGVSGGSVDQDGDVARYAVETGGD